MLYERKPLTVEARRHEGPRITVISDEHGEQYAVAGDYLIGSERGKVYVMDAGKFESDFEPVPPPAKAA